VVGGGSRGTRRMNDSNNGDGLWARMAQGPTFLGGGRFRRHGRGLIPMAAMLGFRLIRRRPRPVFPAFFRFFPHLQKSFRLVHTSRSTKRDKSFPSVQECAVHGASIAQERIVPVVSERVVGGFAANGAKEKNTGNRGVLLEQSTNAWMGYFVRRTARLQKIHRALARDTSHFVAFLEEFVREICHTFRWGHLDTPL